MDRTTFRRPDCKRALTIFDGRSADRDIGSMQGFIFEKRVEKYMPVTIVTGTVIPSSASLFFFF
jgi:hypothetical protein